MIPTSIEPCYTVTGYIVFFKCCKVKQELSLSLHSYNNDKIIHCGVCGKDINYKTKRNQKMVTQSINYINRIIVDWVNCTRNFYVTRHREYIKALRFKQNETIHKRTNTTDKTMVKRSSKSLSSESSSKGRKRII